MPSPSAEHPGLFIRDPYKYTDAMMVIPPVLAPCLECFDGGHTELDLRQMLVEMTGQLDVGSLVDHLRDTLSSAGFLEDDAFAVMRDTRMREFAGKLERAPAHAGSAYPDAVQPLRETMARYFTPDGDGPLP